MAILLSGGLQTCPESLLTLQHIDFYISVYLELDRGMGYGASGSPLLLPCLIPLRSKSLVWRKEFDSSQFILPISQGDREDSPVFS